MALEAVLQVPKSLILREGFALKNHWCILLGCSDFNCLPTNGFSIKQPKVKLLAGEQISQPRIQSQALFSCPQSQVI